MNLLRIIILLIFSLNCFSQKRTNYNERNLNIKYLKKCSTSNSTLNNCNGVERLLSYNKRDKDFEFINNFFCYVLCQGSENYRGSQVITYYMGGWPYDTLSLDDLYNSKISYYIIPIFKSKKNHYLFEKIIDKYLLANANEKFNYLDFVAHDILLEIKDWVNLHNYITSYQCNALIKLYSYLRENKYYDDNLAYICLDLLRFSNSRKSKSFLVGKKIGGIAFQNSNIITRKSKDKGAISYHRLIRSN